MVELNNLCRIRQQLDIRKISKHSCEIIDEMKLGLMHCDKSNHECEIEKSQHRVVELEEKPWTRIKRNSIPFSSSIYRQDQTRFNFLT